MGDLARNAALRAVEKNGDRRGLADVREREAERGTERQRQRRVVDTGPIGQLGRVQRSEE